MSTRLRAEQRYNCVRIGANSAKGVLWPIIPTSTSEPPSIMPWNTNEPCERLQDERTFGGDCTVPNATVTDALGQCIRRHEMQKITRKISVGPLIVAHIDRRSGANAR